MTIKYKNPYGDSSFETFNKENVAFVDKTGFIEVIDHLDTKYPVLLRPRRFGKTTFVQMLLCFYDISYKDKYDEIFKGTKILEMNLPSHNTYHVIKFDFSGVSGDNSKDLITNFNHKLAEAFNNFNRRYPDFNFNCEQVELSPSAFIGKFFSHYEMYAKAKNLYILIDEYDNFANDVLSNNRDLFKTITQSNGFLKDFYKTIKTFTNTVVAKTFITGVSSVSLDSLTSGFNIAKNVTCHPKLNEFAGFTKDELVGLIEKLVDTKALNTTAEALAENMRKAYNGYAFSQIAKNTLFNASMCLNYISYIDTYQSIANPEDIVDIACAYDTSKIADIFKYSQEYILNEIIDDYYTDNEFVIDKLSESINLNLIENYDKTTVLSLLYYLGYLTISPCDDLDEVHLVCQNRLMKKVFRQCFTSALVNETTDEARLSFNLESIIQGNTDIKDFIDSVEKYLSLRITHQHLLHMSEAYIVGLISTKLESSTNKKYKSKDEFEITVPHVGRKFVDLVIDNKKGTCYLFEFKFYSKTKAQKHPSILQEKIAEATAQINSYKTAVEFEGKTVYSYIAIFESVNCVHFEQV
ncbi:MAG: ATP-binding protein [Succinivibrio sp.]|nr:ATP-binding protein [Succinivibrio sp.]